LIEMNWCAPVIIDFLKPRPDTASVNSQLRSIERFCPGRAGSGVDTLAQVAARARLTTAHDGDTLSWSTTSETSGMPPDESAEPDKQKPDIEAGEDVESYDVEDDPLPSDAPRKADLKCPNCGAERDDEHELLCLRCGFNMVTLKVEKTKTGDATEVEEEDAEEEAKQVPPVCRPGRGNLRLPIVIGAVSLFVLLIGYLAGAEGLFNPELLVTADDGTKSMPFPKRLKGLLEFVALVICWGGASMVGLLVLAALTDTKLGDLRLAVVRVVGIVLAMRLVTLFVDVPSPRWEFLMELPLQAGIFFGLSLVLFELKPRDTGIYALVTLAGIILLWVLGAPPTLN
jgi:hypothetical protein